ncbi:hypothetical protein ACWEHT_21085 [Streptomyces sp. NPDC004646]
MDLITNLLNPKVAILYLALIPQFIDPSRGHTTAQGFTLGAIQIAVGLTVNGLIVLATGAAALMLVRQPSRRGACRRCPGAGRRGALLRARWRSC